MGHWVTKTEFESTYEPILNELESVLNRLADAGKLGLAVEYIQLKLKAEHRAPRF
jgi:hypothetical protein